MTVIEHTWRINVCRDCGAQVFGGGLCRGHHPAGQTDKVEVVRASTYQGAVAENEKLHELLREAMDWMTDDEAATFARYRDAALDRVRGQ